MDVLEEGNGAPFSIICRICLKAKQGMNSVYSSTIPDILMYCVSVKVERGDGLPNLICTQCMKQVQELFMFKQLCEKSESLLKQYLPLRIIPAQDLTIEDVTQNQILDTLEDPTLTSTSVFNEPLLEPLDENGQLEDEDDLIPLSQYEDSSLFSQELDFDSEQSLCVMQDIHYASSFQDTHDNSWTHTALNTPVKLSTQRDFTFEGCDGYRCDECREVFVCDQDLSIHMSVHYGNGLPKCNVCNKLFRKKESLKRHVKRHMRNKPIGCKICDKKFSYKSDLRRHLKRHTTCAKLSNTPCANGHPHSDDGRNASPLSLGIPCPCSKPVVDTNAVLAERSREMHLEMSTNLKQVFKLKESNLSDPEGRFKCLMCTGRSYKRIASLREHVCKAHPQTEEAVKLSRCDVCQLQFQKFSELAAHKAQHQPSLYNCHICTKSFPNKYRKRHMLCHLKKGEIKEINGNYISGTDPSALSGRFIEQQCQSPYSKPECSVPVSDVTLVGANEMVNNNNTMAVSGSNKSNTTHTGDTLTNSGISCEICKTKVVEAKDLSVHMSLHPVNTSVWQCNVCSKQFFKKTFLSRHIKIHMTRETHPCHLCHKRFYEKSKLRKHIAKIHYKESAVRTPNESQLPPANCVATANSDAALPYLHTPTMKGIAFSSMTLSRVSECYKQFKDSSQYPLYRPEKENSDLCTSETSPQSLLNGNSSQSTLVTSHVINENMDSSQLADNLRAENYFSCEVCGKTFAKAIKLSLHMRSHNQVGDVSAKYLCQMPSLDSAQLDRNISQVHGGAVDSSASDQAFDSFAALRLHMEESQHGESAKQLS